MKNTEVFNYLFQKSRNEQILSLEDLKFIIQIINPEIKLLCSKHTYLGYYNFHDNSIVINYDRLIQTLAIKFKTSYINFNSLDRIILFNSIVIRIIFHELSHYEQHLLLKGHDEETKIIKLSNLYSEKSNEISNHFKSDINIYRCIPVERSAEIRSYKKIIELLEYSEYKKLLMKLKEELRLIQQQDYKFNRNTGVLHTPFDRYIQELFNVGIYVDYDKDEMFSDKFDIRLDYGLKLTKKEILDNLGW